MPGQAISQTPTAAPVTLVRSTDARETIARVFRVIGCVAVLLTSAVAYLFGLLFNFLFVLMLLAVPVTIGVRFWGLIRKRLEFGFVRRPFARQMRRYLVQCLNRWLFWGLLVVTSSLAIPRFTFELGEYRQLLVGFVWTPAILLMLLQLIPHQRVSLAKNLAFAIGWLFLGAQMIRVHASPPVSRAVVLTVPFEGEWVVFQGGRSSLLNHHYAIPAQRHALDLCKLVEGRTSKGDSQKLESYAAFGQNLLAPADGKVAKVVNNRKDEPIGGSDAEILFGDLVGNQVVIEIGPEKFILLAHLMKDSVVVREGDPVRRGDKIARCGNSGNTSEPHLHLQVQSRANFDAPDLKTYPMLFSDVRRTRSGRTELLTHADLRRNDRIVNVAEAIQPFNDSTPPQ